MGIMPKDKPVVINADNFSKKQIFKYSFVNPKILGLLTVVLLIVVGVGSGVYLTQTPSQTQTQATIQTSEISLKPSEIETEKGEIFTIDLFGNSNSNQITSAQLTVQYDPEFLDLISITPKQFLPKILIPPTIASGSATVSLGTDGNAGISGSGILATLSFKAKQPVSSTQIGFDQSQTRINTLGNTASPLEALGTAQVTITPGKVEQPTPQAPSEEIPAEISFDFNSDSQINSVDLSVIYSAWGEPKTELQKKADLNGDGLVNGLDYAKFIPNLKK